MLSTTHLYSNFYSNYGYCVCILLVIMLRGCLRIRERHPHLNLAVSGSISRSSRTGDRGTLAENFSRKRGKNKSSAFQSGISSCIKMTLCLKMTELMVFATWAGRQSDGIEMQNWFFVCASLALTYEWPHHWIIHLPNCLKWHPAIHVNCTS